MVFLCGCRRDVAIEVLGLFGCSQSVARCPAPAWCRSISWRCRSVAVRSWPWVSWGTLTA